MVMIRLKMWVMQKKSSSKKKKNRKRVCVKQSRKLKIFLQKLHQLQKIGGSSLTHFHRRTMLMKKQMLSLRYSQDDRCLGSFLDTHDLIVA
jgi:hypothetical protein